jgi:hypothetical protein
MNEALVLETFDVNARYEDNPVKATVYCMMPPWRGALFVRVSTNLKLQETLIFKSDDKGKVLDWGELEGIGDVIPHDEMMIRIGYQPRMP